MSGPRPRDTPKHQDRMMAGAELSVLTGLMLVGPLVSAVLALTSGRPAAASL